MADNKKQIVFISYTHSDYYLVEILESLIKSRDDLSTLIVANNREAQNPLIDKVARGIESANYIVPILTSNSIGAQWINQEIGFSSALKKEILPIIDKNILGSLKGFVHKEVDQPYAFSIDDQESFIEKAKLLIKDIPKTSKVAIKPTKNIDLAKTVREDKLYVAKRKSFQDNPDSLKRVLDELYSRMFPYLEEQLRVIRLETSLPFPNEISSNNPHGYIIKAEGLCFSIVWNQKFIDSIMDSSLTMRYWQGYISFDNQSYAPPERPKNISTKTFEVDIDRNDEIIWIETKGTCVFKSEKIVDECFEWLLSTIK